MLCDKNGFMRITGGQWGRRLLKVPKTDIRPTQDRVREAVFATLGPHVVGCRFLDLFAGSGAVGLEAASRGACAVVMVEEGRHAHAVISANMADLGTGSGVQVVSSDVFRYIAQAPAGGGFDYIYADPPYDRTGVQGWLHRLLAALRQSMVLTPAGLFIMEQSSRESVVPLNGWTMVIERRYGETVVRYFRRTDHDKGES